MNICERPKCNRETTGDLLYCSDRCYDLDNDDITSVTVRGQGGVSIHTRYTRTPVFVPGSEAARQVKHAQDEFARACGAVDFPVEEGEAA